VRKYACMHPYKYVFLQEATSFPGEKQAWASKNGELGLLLGEARIFLGMGGFRQLGLKSQAAPAESQIQAKWCLGKLKKRRFHMAIQNWSERTIFVDLPGEPELEEKLQEVAQLIQERGDCDVVMDLSKVTMLNSSCLAILLRLRRQLLDRGHRLVLCNISRLTQGILSVTGLDHVFELGDDKPEALATMQTHS